jgi:hypothetical protein
MKIESQEDKADFALSLAVLSQYSMNHPVTGPRALRFAQRLFKEYAQAAHPFDVDLMREDINEVNIEGWSKV